MAHIIHSPDTVRRELGHISRITASAGVRETHPILNTKGLELFVCTEKSGLEGRTHQYVEQDPK